MDAPGSSSTPPRNGNRAGARQALERLAQTTRASGTDWALGSEAWPSDLLPDNESADALYREPIERLGRKRRRVEWPTRSTGSGGAEPNAR